MYIQRANNIRNALVLFLDMLDSLNGGRPDQANTMLAASTGFLRLIGDDLKALIDDCDDTQYAGKEKARHNLRRLAFIGTIYTNQKTEVFSHSKYRGPGLGDQNFCQVIVTENGRDIDGKHPARYTRLTNASVLADQQLLKKDKYKTIYVLMSQLKADWNRRDCWIDRKTTKALLQICQDMEFSMHKISCRKGREKDQVLAEMLALLPDPDLIRSCRIATTTGPRRSSFWG